MKKILLAVVVILLIASAYIGYSYYRFNKDAYLSGSPDEESVSGNPYDDYKNPFND